MNFISVKDPNHLGIMHITDRDTLCAAEDSSSTTRGKFPPALCGYIPVRWNRVMVNNSTRACPHCAAILKQLKGE